MLRFKLRRDLLVFSLIKMLFHFFILISYCLSRLPVKSLPLIARNDSWSQNVSNIEVSQHIERMLLSV